MAATAEPVSTPAIRLADHSPAVLAAIAFAILFSKPAVLLLRDWWNDPDAGHGLLLAPLAIWLAWRSGLVAARPARVSGALILTGAVLLRYLSGLAAELFTMRVSLLMGAAGLVLFWYGWR
ncbi:MAG TPA: archaeosortase/exosortase family protein, partial [Gemmatimonadales bacterium]|nr:archaeosortase/exosortase family protein [Gemmatimonadales bacterium]